MADNAAGIGRTCHLAGVVGIGIVVNRRAGAEDSAVLDIARNAAYVFGAGDGAEIAHIRESATILERSGNAADFLIRAICALALDRRAIGDIPHGAVVNETGEPADTLTRAGYGAGCTGPADMRTVLQGTGYRADLVFARDGNITERQVHKVGRIAGRPCCTDQTDIILVGAVDRKVTDAKDPFATEAVDGAGKWIRSVADGIEALTLVPLVRVDVVDGRFVKMRTLEFIVSLLEWGFQSRVVTDGPLQGIVLIQGCGRIAQCNGCCVEQCGVRLQLFSRRLERLLHGRAIDRVSLYLVERLNGCIQCVGQTLRFGSVRRVAAVNALRIGQVRLCIRKDSKDVRCILARNSNCFSCGAVRRRYRAV